jgi:hypothetical protein
MAPCGLIRALDRDVSLVPRGRARLPEINGQAHPLLEVKPASPAVARYVALFNQQNSRFSPIPPIRSPAT